MRKTKQVLLTAVCAMLLVATSILGTIAYLTSEAEVVNTFTIGQVEITLDETEVNKDGQPILDENDEIIRSNKGNEYHLIPGMSYLKDPQITVVAGSEKAYVRMILTVKNKADVLQSLIKQYKNDGVEDFSDLFSGWINEFSSENKEIWEYIGFETSDNDQSISFEFRYRALDDLGNIVNTVDVSDATENMKLPPLFTSINVPTSFTGDDMKQLYSEENAIEIIVVGQAIQAVGFVEDVEQGTSAEYAAWEAFAEQNTNN